MFKYHHTVQFYETDLMGIVHHSNYLRYCEEARVAWAQSKGLIDYQKPTSASHFAVLETKVRHLKPLFFGDKVEIQLQVQLDKVRIIFEYKITCSARGQELAAVVRTEHVPLDKDLKLLRPSPEMKSILEKETWTETWLSNL
jgi:acyl-CoA thioester hydrolase